MSVARRPSARACVEAAWALLGERLHAEAFVNDGPFALLVVRCRTTGRVLGELWASGTVEAEELAAATAKAATLCRPLNTHNDPTVAVVLCAETRARLGAAQLCAAVGRSAPACTRAVLVHTGQDDATAPWNVGYPLLPATTTAPCDRPWAIASSLAAPPPGAAPGPLSILAVRIVQPAPGPKGTKPCDTLHRSLRSRRGTVPALGAVVPVEADIGRALEDAAPVGDDPALAASTWDPAQSALSGTLDGTGELRFPIGEAECAAAAVLAVRSATLALLDAARDVGDDDEERVVATAHAFGYEQRPALFRWVRAVGSAQPGIRRVVAHIFAHATPRTRRLLRDASDPRIAAAARELATARAQRLMLEQ